MLIDRFIDTGREFLGCKYPIMCGAMTWISDPKLVSVVGNCGGFGLLAGGNAPIEVLKNQILETREMTDHPFGANIITLAPVYKDQLKLVCDMECEFIVFAGGIPKKNAVIDGDVTKGSLMAGQSVGLVDDVKPLKSIIDEMIDDAESELKRLQRIFVAEST